MAGEKSKVETFGTVLKNTVSALRDSVVFLLFVLLLFAPNTIKQRLIEAGFTKGSIGGFEWEGQIKSAAETTKSAGQTVVQATENYDKLIERLVELKREVNDPSLQSEFEKIDAVAKTSRSELATADQAIKQSLVAQQQIVNQIAPSTVIDSGWIFLGKIIEDKSTWFPSSSPTIRSEDARISRGDKLTIQDDVYLRGDGPPQARSSAPILAVVKEGETVEVTDIDYSHAKGGGWFVWARVRRV